MCGKAKDVELRHFDMVGAMDSAARVVWISDVN